MVNLSTLMYEKISRKETKLRKWFKRGFKVKEPGDDFLKTVKIYSEPLDEHVEFKMRLDTGCDIHNLITSQVVNRLAMQKQVALMKETLCVCLNGEMLLSVGTIVLEWKGKRFRKVFTTNFHIVDADLPWEVVLGAGTIQQHKILKFAGFGGATLTFPKKKRDERSDAELRKQQHLEKAAANDAKVNASKTAREQDARQSKLKKKEAR